MGVPEVFVCRSCDKTWSPLIAGGNRGLDLISASVASEKWFLAPGAAYFLGSEGRGIDEEDASISLKVMSEKLDLATKVFRAGKILKACLVKSKSHLIKEEKWSGSFKELKAISSYSLIPSFEGVRFKETERSSVVHLDYGGESSVFLDGAFGLTPPKSILETISAGKDFVLDYDGSLSDNYAEDVSIAWLFAFDSPGNLWKLCGHSIPTFVGAVEEIDGISMCFESWGGSRSKVMIPGTFDSIMSDFDWVVDCVNLAGDAIKLGPAPRNPFPGVGYMEFSGISQPIKFSSMWRPDTHHPVEMFVFAGDKFLHTGAINEDDRGKYSGVVSVKCVDGNSKVAAHPGFEVRTVQMRGSTRSEIGESIEKKRNGVADHYFESVKWKTLDNSWSAMYDVKTMNFWESRSFWSHAASCPNGSPVSDENFMVSGLEGGLRSLVQLMMRG